jgi:hypothetical protein
MINRNKNNRGFSLVELLIASAICVLTIIAVVMVLRKGGETLVTTQHRQRARAIIDSCFEVPAYQYTNYAAIVPTPTPVGVVIDSRMVPPLAGTLTTLIGPEVTGNPALVNAAQVNYKPIVITVKWQESGSAASDSVMLEKRISKI